MYEPSLTVIFQLNNWYALGYLGKKFTPDQLIKWTPVVSVLTYFLLVSTLVVDVWTSVSPIGAT